MREANYQQRHEEGYYSAYQTRRKPDTQKNNTGCRQGGQPRQEYSPRATQAAILVEEPASNQENDQEEA